jgi:hypothetical protein
MILRTANRCAARRRLVFIALIVAGLVASAKPGYAQTTTHGKKPAAVPLYRDPVHDGSADPVVIWNRARKVWWMFYTNRRANIADTNGVRWVHGTHIGIAESRDGGAHWKYVSEADIPLEKPDYTLWAPEVIDVDGTYHMFLTVVPGTFSDWNAPRHIEHLTSKDLLHWTAKGYLDLTSDRTIDACVFRLPDGIWRLWYKNERDGSKIYYSDSPDLEHWTAKGIAIKTRGEGPVAFQWHGSYWLINDSWAGLGAFRSDDLTNWTRQPDNLLREPGTQPTDRAMGNHPDVVVDASGRAWLFYFTQQRGEDAKADEATWQRRSVLHVTELHEKDGILTVDRNAPAYIHMLPPPKNKKSDGLKIASAANLRLPLPPVGARSSSPLVLPPGNATAAEWFTPRGALPSQPEHISSGVMAGLLIHKVNPIFPTDVDASGTIVLDATISKRGTIEKLSVISGPLILRQAVIQAVEQWRYKPYLFSSQPLEVETTISVQSRRRSPYR